MENINLLVLLIDIFYYLWIFLTLMILSLISIFNKQFINTIKNEFKTLKGYKIVIFMTLQPLFVSLLTPFSILLLMVFFIYKKCIDFALKIYHKNKYGGMLKGPEIYFSMDDQSKSIVNFLTFVEFEGSPTEFYDTVKKYTLDHVFLDKNVDPRIKGVRKHFMGYFFILKNEYGIDDCISTLNYKNDSEEINEKELQKIMNDLSIKPLPKDNDAFWEIIVGNKPIIKDCKRQYPLITRFHHSLAEGTAIILWCLKYYADKHVTNTKKCSKEKTSLTFFQRILNFAVYTTSFIAALEITCLQTLKNSEDNKNVLHPDNISGNKILLSSIEKEKKYIDLIKNIKKKLPGVSFTHILLTAVTISLENYMKEVSKEVCADIHCLITAAKDFPNFTNYLYSDKNTPKMNCDNFMHAGIYLPVMVSAKTSICKRIDKIRSTTNSLKNSFVFQTNQLIVLAMGLFPTFLSKDFVSKSKSTLIFSNLPTSIPSSTTMNGLRISDFAIWTINRGNCGISMLFSSYDGRLQIGINADRTLFADENEVKKISDGIFKHIDHIYDECRKM